MTTLIHILFILLAFCFSSLSAQSLESPNWEEMSYLLVERGEWQNAIDLYDSVLTKEPKSIQAKLLKLDAYLNLNKGAEVLKLAKEFDSKVKLSSSEKFRLINIKAAAYIQINSLNAAIDLLNKNIKILPKNPMLYYNLGKALYKKKRFQKANAALVKCIDLYPRFVDAHLLLSKVLVHSPKPEYATIALAYAMTLNPWQDSSRVLFNHFNSLIEPKLSPDFLANPSSKPDQVLIWLNPILAKLTKEKKNSIWAKIYGKFFTSLKTNNHHLAYYYFIQQGLKDSARDHWILANTLTMEPFYMWLSSKLPPEEIPLEN